MGPLPTSRNRIIDRFNFGGYANVRVDSLLTAALAETDRERSLPLWYALQEELSRDQPAAILYYLRQVVAVDRRIRDARPHMLGALNNLHDLDESSPTAVGVELYAVQRFPIATEGDRVASRQNLHRVVVRPRSVSKRPSATNYQRPEL